MSLFPLVLLSGADKEQGPPPALQPVRSHELIPRILGPLPRMNTALLPHARYYLQPRNVNWIGDPAAFGPCSLSTKKSDERCFPIPRVRSDSRKYAKLALVTEFPLAGLPAGTLPDITQHLQQHGNAGGSGATCRLLCAGAWWWKWQRYSPSTPQT